MIDCATAAMFPALKRVWAACFGDDEFYVNHIFAHLLSPRGILVRLAGDGSPAAMLCLQPFRMLSGGESADAAYIFGVATLPEHRGKGYGTALLDEAHRRLMEKEIALSVLAPAGEKMFGFYGDRGYGTAFRVKKVTCPGGGIPPAGRPFTLSPAAFGAISAMRDAFYADRALYARWDVDYLRYIGGECRMMGGDVLLLSCAGRAGFAVCYPVGDTCVVKELAVPQHLFGDMLAALHERYAAREYTLYLPEDTETDYPNKVLPFAMIKWYDKQKQAQLAGRGGKAPYIAHVLD